MYFLRFLAGLRHDITIEDKKKASYATGAPWEMFTFSKKAPSTTLGYLFVEENVLKSKETPVNSLNKCLGSLLIRRQNVCVYFSCRRL